MSTGKKNNPSSTWQDRRLFQDLKGILPEEMTRKLMTSAEDLPIPEDQYVFGGATAALAQMIPESASRKAEQVQLLTAAGYLSRAAWQNLAAVRFVVVFISLLLIGTLLILSPPALEPYFVGALLVGPIVIWAIPALVVGSWAAQRRAAIESGIPDVLDMLNMCISQGLTLQRGLRRITPEIRLIHPELYRELSIVCFQSDLSGMQHALQAFSSRIGSQDVTSFTSLLVQSESTGTSLSAALREYSDSIRSTLRERADARANSASFQLLFPVTLLLMPSIFMFLLGPAIIRISDFYGEDGTGLQQSRQQMLDSLGQ